MTTLPKTVLQIVGAPQHASALDRSALILIDHQMEYVTGALPLDGIDEAVAEAAILLDIARDHHMPVFHVVHHGPAGGPLFDPEGDFARIIPTLSPAAGETVVTKSLPNSFTGTNLHNLIQNTGRKELVIVGFMTHACVSATARAALDLGYRSTVIAGATATRDLPSAIDGSIVPAARIQEAELSALADRVAVVVPNGSAFLARQPSVKPAV